MGCDVQVGEMAGVKQVANSGIIAIMQTIIITV